MTQKLNMTAPFAKVNSTDDGGREVWGFATLERVDKSGEIADFDGTVKAFQTWASDTEKRTGGKSKGNVRLMHQPIVAGKAIHWEPTETEIDGETYKGVWVGAYVPPTKVDVIKDIDEGILSGFSIGGSYEKRWWDETAKAFRFIPTLAEFSLVDNPCVPGADITQVIQKAVVPTVEYNFRELSSDETHPLEGVLEVDDNRVLVGATRGENVAKSVMDDGSIEALQQRINEACKEKYRGVERWWDGYVARTFRDKVIIFDWSQDKYFEVPYEDKDGQIILGEATEVVQINAYIPVDALKSIHDTELQKRQAKEVEKSVNHELLAKAVEAAGITPEQAKMFLEGLSKAQDTPPAPESVEVVDGDGDKDDNKEFPNPPSGDEKVNIAEGEKDAKDNEEAVGVAEKSADSTEVAKDGVDVEDEPQGDPEDEDDEKCMGKAIELLQSVHGKLEKAGKAISAKNAEHLHKAIGHVTAALSGNHGYTCGAAGQGNTGEEAPEVTAKSIVGEMQKSVQAEVSELTNKVESLVKGLASHDALTKAFEPLAKSIESITTRLGDMEKMVKEIHETPLPTGVALNGGSPDVAKMFAKGNFAEMANTSDDVVLDFIKSVNDPQVRAKLGEELALRQMKQSLSNPTIR